MLGQRLKRLDAAVVERHQVSKLAKGRDPQAPRNNRYRDRRPVDYWRKYCRFAPKGLTWKSLTLRFRFDPYAEVQSAVRLVFEIGVRHSMQQLQRVPDPDFCYIKL